MKNPILMFALVLTTLFLFVSCENDEIDEVLVVLDDTSFETSDWTENTHGKSADPNFDEVFEDNVVKRLDVVISEAHWQNMLDDMTNTYGAFGTGGRGGLLDTDENPVFVPSEIFYNGKEWYKVGIRFKGNSSLQSSWQNGILKLSFKLDFDEFEDDFPQIENQRFYGFKKLSLKNNFEDPSMMREKVAGDVFRKVGLAASHTAFYTLYVDYGDGPIYFGVYTMVEEVDDTVIEEQFSDDNGNLYKPDGDGASFAEGTFSESVFVKKTNEDESDWSDIIELFSVLHDETRTSSPSEWRSNLEAIFDVDGFLKYLATNTVIQNWDTYGRMTHNYFLYDNPDNDLLTWIPWDNNEALQIGKSQGSLPLNFSGLSASQWPLIGYLYADVEYKAKYDYYVQEVVDDAFEVTQMQGLYDTYATLLEPYATTEIEGYTFLNSSTEFFSELNELKSHVSSRNTAVNNYLK